MSSFFPVIAALAEPEPASSALTPADRRQEFVAVQGGKEGTSAQTLLVAAYLVMWALLLGFIFLGWRRAGRIAERLDGLEKSLARHEKKQGD